MQSFRLKIRHTCKYSAQLNLWSDQKYHNRFFIFRIFFWHLIINEVNSLEFTPVVVGKLRGTDMGGIPGNDIGVVNGGNAPILGNAAGDPRPETTNKNYSMLP